ncbi:MAG: phage holin family protein [Paracoccaceae bacterium]
MVTALQQFSRLMQDEVALAKAEVSRNVSRAGAGLAMIGVAALLALTALNVLAGALVAFLATTGITVGAAALLVGGVLLVVAVVLVMVGKSRLTADAVAPTRAAENLKSDLDTMKEHTHA